MPIRTHSARLDPVSIARAVHMRDGKVIGTHYSVEKVPVTHVRRRLKALKHLYFMKQEDQS